MITINNNFIMTYFKIYLYDTLPDKSFNKRPRHCLPYAIITWLKFNDGKFFIKLLN
jgi:hypothetical protein